MTLTNDTLVDMTAAKLEELYREIDEVSLSPVEDEGLDLLEELEIGKNHLFPLAEKDRDDIDLIEKSLITQRWRQGMDPADRPDNDRPTYAVALHDLVVRNNRSHAETYGLDLHAVSYLNSRNPIPSIIRRYLAERLMSLPRPKSNGGRSKENDWRNYGIVSIIEDLARDYKLPVYSKIDDVKEQSACWIVAEAQKKLGRSPRSPSTVAKLYLAVNKELKQQGV